MSASKLSKERKKKKKEMKNSSNASKQAAMESKADSKGSLANKGWRAGEPGEAAERSLSIPCFVFTSFPIS